MKTSNGNRVNHRSLERIPEKEKVPINSNFNEKSFFTAKFQSD